MMCVKTVAAVLMPLACAICAEAVGAESPWKVLPMFGDTFCIVPPGTVVIIR